MQVTSLSNAIISTLGNPSSKVPLAIKDTINSSGLTYFSFDAGGKLEGKDRFIDEFGTQIIWLGGLPFFRWIADKTMYKAKGLNPNVDIRVARSEDHVKFAKQILSDSDEQGQEMLSSINKAVEKMPTFKKLFYSKFALATILTFASYFALTHYKQKTTEKAVIKEYMAKKANDDLLTEKVKEVKTFENFSRTAFNGKQSSKAPKTPSFKGFNLQSFMFDPVKNLMIIDAGITTERLHKARNKYEFAEYAIKEGSLLFFMYKAGSWIQNGIEKLSKTKLNMPVSMDLRFINSNTLKQAIGTEKLKTEIAQFSKLKSQKEILNYIVNNQDSTIVQGAKISGLIGQFEKTGKINPGAYIDTNEMKNFVSMLEEFVQQSRKSDLKLSDFMKKARNYKIGAIFANIGICCAALGYVMPKIMFEYRKKFAGSKEFHVAKHLEEKLAQSDSANKI